MKIPNQSNNSLDEKFVTIKSLSDLPADHHELFNAHKNKILDIILDANNSNPEGNTNPDGKLFSLGDYIAFQSLQVQALQRDLQVAFNTLLEMGKVLDTKDDSKTS